MGRRDSTTPIRRLQAFEAAGADSALRARRLRDLETMRALTSAVSKPVTWVMSSGDSVDHAAQLEAAGVKRVSVGGALFAPCARRRAQRGPRDDRAGRLHLYARHAAGAELKAIPRR